MPSKKEGGVNVQNTRDVNVQGDIVGRDKSENIYVNVPVEEKSGCVYTIEKATIFIFTWLIGSIVMAVFAGGITALIFAAVSGGDSTGTGAVIGAGLGILLALGMAISNASSVKRNK